MTPRESRDHIIVTCPECGKPKLWGRPCGWCGKGGLRGQLKFLVDRLWRSAANGWGQDSGCASVAPFPQGGLSVPLSHALVGS
jgi:hypothetical protein